MIKMQDRFVAHKQTITVLLLTSFFTATTLMIARDANFINQRAE